MGRGDSDVPLPTDHDTVPINLKLKLFNIAAHIRVRVTHEVDGVNKTSNHMTLNFKLKAVQPRND